MTSPTGNNFSQPAAAENTARKISRGGFTLLEMVLVIVLLSLIALTVQISFGRFHQKTSLDESARRLAGTLRFAHFRAVNEGLIYRVCLDQETSSFWVEKNHEGRFIPAEDSLSKKKVMKNTRIFKADYSPPITVGKTLSVEFHPDGSGQNVLLYLQNKKEDITTVEVKKPTGRVIVHEGLYEH